MSKLITDKIKTATGSEITLPSTYNEGQVLTSTNNTLSFTDIQQSFTKTVWDSDVDASAFYIDYTLENDWEDLKAILLRFDGIRVTSPDVDYVRPAIQYMVDDTTATDGNSIVQQYTRYNTSSTYNATTSASTYTFFLTYYANTTVSPASVTINDLDEAWSAETNLYFAPNVGGNKAGASVTRGQWRQNPDSSPTSPYTDGRFVNGFNLTYTAFDASNRPNYYWTTKPTMLRFISNYGQSNSTWTGGKISIAEITL